MYSIEIEIPLAATSANRTRGVNGYALHKTFSAVKKQIHLLTLGRRPASPLTSFKISVIRYSSRAMDYDNLISSLKPAIDALTLSKIIQDDSWKYIRSIDIDQVIGKEKKLLIKVNEVPEIQGTVMKLRQGKVPDSDVA